MTPRQYADALPAAAAAGGAEGGPGRDDRAVRGGYSGPSRLYERAPAQLGMTPAAYRRAAPARASPTRSAACPLGRLLVAATAQGICAVSSATRTTTLEAELRRDFPRATITRDDGELAEAVAAILQHLAGARPRLDLPIDVQGTAFQRRRVASVAGHPLRRNADVWRAGGGAGRAAGGAGGGAAPAPPTRSRWSCRATGPCARTASLAGYRWGLGRKEALLAAERASAARPEGQNEDDARAIGA